MRRGLWARLDSLQRAALGFGVLAIVLFAVLAGRPSFSNASRPRWGSAMLSLQLARGVDDVDLVLGEQPSPDREVLRVKTYLDFAFIACYLPWLLVLAGLVARAGGWRHAAGIAAAVCALGAGVFDALENRAILHILDVPLRFTTPAMLSAIRGASVAKWSLGAATLVQLSICLIRRTHEPST